MKKACLKEQAEMKQQVEQLKILVAGGERMLDDEDTRPVRHRALGIQREGDVIFLHKLTPHCSEPNRTNRIRWSMDLRYQRTGTHSGRACYPSFVARSRSQPSAELLDWRVWKKSWQTALKAYPTKLPRSTRPEEPIEQSIEL